ncbi:MAG: electron transfer flavoprotein subunit beta/FixA family protein [Chlorobiota bacterium]
MNILVCVSRVPDTAAKIKVSSDNKSLDTAGVKFILNPYDEYALEEAIQLKEKNGGELTVVTVADDSATDILRTALAMGADKAIHIKANQLEKDSFFVAKNISNVAKELNPDIIFLGKQSIDFDSFQMSAMLGGLLDLPSVDVVSQIEYSEGSIKGEKDIEGGKVSFESSLPAVVSVQKGIKEPRYPKLPQIMKAKKKPIEDRDAEETALRTELIEMAIPEKNRAGKILSDSDADINELVRLLHEEAKVI